MKFRPMVYIMCKNVYCKMFFNKFEKLKTGLRNADYTHMNKNGISMIIVRVLSQYQTH
jgi:hypothetical protein